MMIPSPPPSASGSASATSPPPDPPPPLRSPSPPPEIAPPHRVSLSLLVVPEGTPTRRVGPLKQNLFFRYISERSGWISKRQAAGKTRQPLINDVHIARLHSDKVWAERQLKMKRVEHEQLVLECTALRTHRDTAVRDANTAWDLLHQFPEFISERNYYSQQQVQITHLLQKVKTAEVERDKAKTDYLKSVQKGTALKAALASTNVTVRQQAGRLATALSRLEQATERADQSRTTVKKMTGDVNALRTSLGEAGRQIILLQEAVGCGEGRVEELEGRAEELEAKLSQSEELLEGLTEVEDRLANQLAVLTAPKRGRPIGHRGAGSRPRPPPPPALAAPWTPPPWPLSLPPPDLPPVTPLTPFPLSRRLARRELGQLPVICREEASVLATLQRHQGGPHHCWHG